MATVYWTGNALARRQVQTITVASTWLDTETATLTMNGKDLVLTLVGNESTATVATALKEMWMSHRRLDGTGTTDATSNAGGQEFGEFSEVTATVSGSVVTLTANTAGVPFTVTVGETSASGTLTLDTVQEATGPEFWDDGDNWTGGSAPSYGDLIILRDSDVSVRYNLPTGGGFEATLWVYSTYTGHIGLPTINRSNPKKPYREYRDAYLEFTEVTSNGDTYTHKFGIGDGPGSSFISFRHTRVTDTIIHVQVFNTGTPLPGESALQLVVHHNVTDVAGVGSITVTGGSVMIGAVGETNKYGILNVRGDQTVVRVIEQQGNNFALNQSGGRVEFVDVTTLTSSRAFDISGGACVVQDMNISGSFTASVRNSRLVFNGAGTIATLTLETGGIFDLEQYRGVVTVSTCDIHAGASVLDQYTRGVYTNGIDLNRCRNADVKIRVGHNRRLTLGAVA